MKKPSGPPRWWLYLDAIRRGDVKKTAEMFTPETRQWAVDNSYLRSESGDLTLTAKGHQVLADLVKAGDADTLIRRYRAIG